MKTIKSLILIIFLTQPVLSQDWNGSASTNKIWRLGNVGIGTEPGNSSLCFKNGGSIYIPSADGSGNYIYSDVQNNMFKFEGSKGFNFFTYHNGWGSRFMISKEGNVGIGTNSIGNLVKLHVKENGSSLNLWRGRIVASGDNNAIVLGERNGKAWFGAHNATLTEWSDLIMQADGGKIGVGTETPAFTFDVNGLAGATARFQGNGQSTISLHDGTNNNYLVGVDGSLSFRPSGVESMYMKNNGNVGIGTNNPLGFRLAVKGKIGAEEIEVKANYWSDFVFQSDYNLKSLDEVELFIKQNNHLPDIPSEKEVKERGINLGDMDAKLLQKIEELTLYMIEQNKETQALRKENELLRKEMNEIKKRMK